MKKLFVSFFILLSIMTLAFGATDKRIDQYSSTTTLSTGDLFLVEKNPGSVPTYNAITWAYVEILMKAYMDGYYQPLDSDLTAIANITGSRGDILYYGASGWTNLPKGTSGYVLTQGTNDPGWAAAAGGGTMVYPDAGVPVSTGSAWGTSIGLTGISDSTSTTSSTVAASATAVKSAYDLANGKVSMTYPGAGVPVSTGSAWGTSLNITGISDATGNNLSTVAASSAAVKTAYDLANSKQNYDFDLTSLSAGVTGIVKGLGNGAGYTAAVAGTDYLAVGSIPFRNIISYGASTSASAATNTAAIQAAINVGPGVVFIPAGTYAVAKSTDSGANYCLKITAAGVTLMGEGPKASILATNSSDANIVHIGSTPSFYGSTIRDLKLTTTVNRTMTNVTPTVSGTDTSKGYAIHISNAGNFNIIENVWLFTDNIGYTTGGGIYMGEYSATHTRNVLGYFNGVAHAIHITGLANSKSNEHHVNNCWFQGSSTTPASYSYGIYIENSDGDWFGDVTCAFFDYGLYSANGSSSKFHNVMVDSCQSYGFVFNGASTYGNVLDCCWAGTIGWTGDGLTVTDAIAYDLAQVQNIILNNCRAQNVGGHAVVVWGNCLDVSILGGWYTGYAYAANNYYDGITTVPNYTGGIRIEGVRVGGTAGSATTGRYGIFIQAGANNFIVMGNDTRNNSTLGLYNAAGTSTTKIVANNL